MNKQIDLSARSHTTGAVAVDGLLHGIAAGIVMALYLIVAALTYGESPAALLGHFNPPGAESPLVGLVMHLGMSAFYGILFALLWWALRRPAAPGVALAAGVGYGFVLALFAELVLLPASHAALQQVPPLHFAIGHVFYGLVLGYLAHRK